MSNYPSVDEPFERLHRAGWSIGDVATSAVVRQRHERGESDRGPRSNTGGGLVAACEVARVVGMLAAPPGQARR